MAIYKLLGNPGQTYATRGKSYTADAKGVVTVDTAASGVKWDIQDLNNMGLVPLGEVQGFDNLSATTDPGVGNDTTQGYVVGSLWVNTSTGRAWVCVSNATGAATWALAGTIPGTGIEPSSMLTYFGGGTGSFGREGNLSRQIVSAGVNPGATGADNVLAVYSLPGGSFDAAGRGIAISAQGSFGATGNNKRVKIIVNPATAAPASK
jgi:hypothetical protein